MTYNYRLATIEDLPAIVEIYNSTVAGRQVTADTEAVSVASRLDWFAAHTPERRPLWVVPDEQGGLLGWLSYSDFYGRPAYNGTAELSIYLHESARGRGLGRFLLQQAIAYAPHIQVHTLLGFIFGHNQPSLNLFYQAGFEKWAELPRVAKMDNDERDLLILGKRLS